MKNKRMIPVLIGFILPIVLIGIAGYLILTNKSTPVVNSTPTPTSTATTTPTTTPTTTTETVYKNTQYGFDFVLPTSWQGYSVVINNWQGQFIDQPSKPQLTGPEILLRHPLWTVKTPRQDIPIMVFTLAQWDLVSQEKISLGAAPIPPSELGRNASYVLALPARYNYAFLPGFEEVEQILAANEPLRTY